MIGIWLTAALAGLGLALFAVERARAPGPATLQGRRARGWTVLLAGALVVLPSLVALVTYTITSTADFGPPRPEDPFRGASEFDFDLDFTDVVYAGLGAVALALAGLGVILFHIGARRSAVTRGLGVPTGHTSLRVLGGVAVAMSLAAAARTLAGGSTEADLRWHGSLVAPGDDGWRAESVVNAVADGPAHEVTLGGAMDDDLVRWSGSDCCGGFAHPSGRRSADGLHGWIGAQPVVFVRTEVGVTMHPVRTRDAGVFEDRPRFAAAPQWVEMRPRWDRSEASDDRVVLLDRSDGVRAVVLDQFGSSAPSRGEVGLVARAPLWAWWLAAPLWLLALASGRGAARHPFPGPRRLFAALCLAIVVAVLFGAFAPALGVG
jgi:hypothetical protein